MAIAYVGAGTQVTATSSPLSPGLPTHSEGDLLLIFVYNRTESGGAVTASGYEQLGSSADGNMVVLYKFAGASESTPSVACASSVSSGWAAQALAYSGVDASQPIDMGLTAAHTVGAGAGTQTGNSTVTSSDGALAVSFAAIFGDGELTLSTAQGYTGRVTGAAGSVGSTYATGIADKTITTAGTIQVSPTWSQTGGADDAWRIVSFALRASGASSSFPYFVAASKQVDATSTPIAVDVPPNVEADDLIVVVGMSPRTVASTFTPDTGYTQLVLNQVDNHGNLVIIYKVAAGSETSVSTGTTSASFWGCSFQVLLFRNVDTSTPWDTTAVSSDTAASASFTPTGVTSTTDNCLVLQVVGYDNDPTDGVRLTTPQSFVEVLGHNYFATLTGQDHSVGVGMQYQASAGSQTAPTWSVSSTSNDWLGISVPVRAGAAASTDLTGTTFQKAPSFPQGTVTFTQDLTGATFQQAPSFTAGQVTTSGTVAGQLFQKAPSFPLGTVSAGLVALTGSTYQIAPSFPTATVANATLVDVGWVGAVTDTTATVKARFSGASATLSAEPGGHSVNGVEGNDDVFTFDLTGLTADTEYTVQIGAGAEAWSGSFTTFPSSGSFVFAVGGDSGNVGGDYTSSGVSPTAPTWDAIAAAEPLFFIHMGDLHYKDISSNNVALFRSAYQAALADKTADMTRSVPVAYVWDDHDFGGNDSDGTDVAKPAVAQAYRDYVPHYTLPASDGYGVWQTFTCGRVRFIITDGRSQRDPKGDTDDATKTLLGADQKAWLENLLDTATEELIVLILPNVWIQSQTAGADSWGGYSTERAEVAGFFTDYGVTSKLLILSADAHMMAMDDGTNSQFDTSATTDGPRVAQLGGIDAGKINIGGPYSEGIAATSKRQIFGTVEVTDSGGDVSVVVKGWSVDSGGTATLEQSLSFTAGELDSYLTGATFTKAPTFPQGTIGAPISELTGATFQKTPTFPQGDVAASFDLAGSTFQKAPTFGSGAVAAGAVALQGTVFQVGPTFPQGTVEGAYTLTGTTFEKAPTFPQGAVTVGAAALVGQVFAVAPTFPQGELVGGVRPRWRDVSLGASVKSAGITAGVKTAEVSAGRKEVDWS